MTNQTVFLYLIVLMLASSCRYRNLPAAQRANHYGIMMAAEGKDSEAITAYMIAAKYTDIPDSNRSVYLENAGISWMALSHADSAVYCFDRAAACSPLKSYQWFICKAYAQKALEHTDSAARLLLKAYATDSNKLAVNNMLGAIFTNSRFSSLYDPSRALRYNIQAFHLKTDIDTRFMLARNYYMIGKYQIALSYYRKIHEEDPFNTAYLVTLILMEEEMANQDRAAVLLDELKQKDSVQYDKVSHEVVIPGVHHLVWGE